MDTTGQVIRRLRREKGLTQPELARMLGAGAEELLRGDLQENPPQGGNMNRIKGYLCPHCGAMSVSVPERKHSCCSGNIPNGRPGRSSRCGATGGCWRCAAGTAV